MTLSYTSSSLPFYFEINGRITQVDYSWKIQPILDSLKEFDHEIDSLNDLFYMLYKAKEWCKEKGYSFILRAAFLFKASFYMFCQLIK